MSDSVRSHRWQPTRLPRPWDSPAKNTGVGCHFLLQCMKVKSESKLLKLCPTLQDPMDCSLPGSSVHGIFQARVLEWAAIAFSGVYIYIYFFFNYIKDDQILLDGNIGKCLSGGTSGKEPACQCRRAKRCRFNPWVRNIPRRTSWQPTPLFFPGKSHGEKGMVGYRPKGPKESD